MVDVSKKQAVKLLHDTGEQFLNDFCSVHEGALRLRSKEPGACWKASGEVDFVAIGEFSGPNTMESESPFLLRLRTNIYPPPAIYYHLKSPAVRYKLGLRHDPRIAVDPALEITATSEEIGQLGKWLHEWFKGLFYQLPQCPQPPVQLISWVTKADLTKTYDDVTAVPKWQQCLYLWTPQAIDLFEPWLHR